MDNNVLGLKANKLIMDVALRGDCGDSVSGILLDWKAVGSYLVVYIEDRETDKTYYRVFRIPEKPYYVVLDVIIPVEVVGQLAGILAAQHITDEGCDDLAGLFPYRTGYSVCALSATLSFVVVGQESRLPGRQT